MLTQPAEAEPRRSVRATKGQHTKSFDELEPTAPKRRQTKKTKKAQEQEQEQEPETDQDQGQDTEEVIRCVCGATEQDEDSGEAWISCETCFAWQHNVCVGVSSYEDEIPDKYYCERCRPEDHKELLEGMARGEKPWEVRRKIFEEESKKKKKPGRRGKGKRVSDTKDEADKEGAAKSKASTPEVASKKDQPGPKQGKRKAREDSHDADGKLPKIRRVSENESAPVNAKYSPPADLANAISELPSTRMGPAKALKKSLLHVMTALAKTGELRSYALQVERAVLDTHPATKGQKEYAQQIKSLSFNLKNNAELFHGILAGTHTPPILAVMTSEQLASAEQQRQTAEMRAKAEKQSILYTSETGPRVRRTHKGEEVVEDETAGTMADIPPPLPGGGPYRRESQHQVKHESVESPLQGDGYTQRSPSNPNFDITKVFSSVKSSPTGPGHLRRASTAATGAGVDPDVDRMLQDEDENDSPPYSPTEESIDPDVVWRGTLAMSSIADFAATAKHIGGANFASIGPWSKLIPKRMAVAGRIPQQAAIEYLCGLRYSTLTDVVVVSLAPVQPEKRAEFNALVDYFVGKKRYGVVGDKVAGNVRDTYLVPVPAGDGGHPEFMLNLVDNFIPKTRAEPMLLAVFVYRNEAEQLKPQQAQMAQQPAAAPAAPATTTPSVTPVPIPVPPGGAAIPSLNTNTAYAQRSNSVSHGPAFSPATPQSNTFPTPSVSTTPVPIPQPPHTNRPPPPAPMTDAQKFQLQQSGQAMAQEVLGPLVNVPTVQFLLPQAFQMSRREWEVVKGIYEQDERARHDLQYLGSLLEKKSAEAKP
ncbi:SPOC domain-containing protein [Stachybotrys elegans]|uniref:Transcription factor BYE1 n=1 Tax=Stachybotrys elegans TaxID=80388 RepID=A0A8K0SWA3_9HYPO|nr:SPOC domain-containing protein [Stachybotrys elegans]